MSSEQFNQGSNICKMFIGGLNPQTNENSLRQYFVQFGDIQDLVIMRDKDQNTSRGFGFITFFNNHILMGVLRSQPHFVDGKQVDCKPAVPKDQQQSIQMLFNGLQRGFTAQPGAAGYQQQHNGINQQQQQQQQQFNYNNNNNYQQQYPYNNSNNNFPQNARQSSNTSLKSGYFNNQVPPQPPYFNPANNFQQQQYPYNQNPYGQQPNFNNNMYGGQNFGNQQFPQQQPTPIFNTQQPPINTQQSLTSFNLSNLNAQNQQQLPLVQQTPSVKKTKSNSGAVINNNQQNNTKAQQQKLKQQTQEFQKQIQKQTLLIKEQEIHINRLQAKYQEQQKKIVKSDDPTQDTESSEVPSIKERKISSVSLSEQNDLKDSQSDHQVNTESTNAQLSPLLIHKDKKADQEQMQLSIESKISEHSHESSSINYTQSKILESSTMLRNQSSMISHISDSQYRKIFVGGLPHNLSDEEFRQFFAQYGDIEDCAILKDKRTGKPRGFGFVTYNNVDQTDYVMSIKDKHFIQDKWVDCKRAVPASVLKDDTLENDKSHQSNHRLDDIKANYHQNNSFSPNPERGQFSNLSCTPSRRPSGQIPRTITPLGNSNQDLSQDISTMINQQIHQNQLFNGPPNMNYPNIPIQNFNLQQLALQQQQQMQQYNLLQNNRPQVPPMNPMMNYPQMNMPMSPIPIPLQQFNAPKPQQLSQFHQQAFNQMMQTQMGQMNMDQQAPFQQQQQQQQQVPFQQQQQQVPFNIPAQMHSPISIPNMAQQHQFNQQPPSSFNPTHIRQNSSNSQQHQLQQQQQQTQQQDQVQISMPLTQQQQQQSVEIQMPTQQDKTKSGYISLTQSPIHALNKRPTPTMSMGNVYTGASSQQQQQQQQQNQQKPQNLQVQTTNLTATPTPSGPVPMMSDDPPSPIEKSKPTPQPTSQQHQQQTFQHALQGFPAFQYLNGQLATPSGQQSQTRPEFKSGFPYSQAFKQQLQNNQQLQDQLNNTSFSLGMGYGNLNQSLNYSLDSIGRKQQEQTEWFIQSLQNQFEQSFTDDAMAIQDQKNENFSKIKKDTIQNINDEIKRNQQKEKQEEQKHQNDEIMIKVDWKQIDSSTNIGGFFTPHVVEKPQQQQAKAAEKQDQQQQQQDQSQQQQDSDKSVNGTDNLQTSKGSISKSSISPNVSQVSTQPQERFRKEQASNTSIKVSENDTMLIVDQTQAIQQHRTSTNLQGLLHQSIDQPRRYVLGSGSNFSYGQDRPSSKTAQERQQSSTLNQSKVEFGQIKSEQKMGPSTRADRQFKPY